MPSLCKDSSLTDCIFSFYLTGTDGSSYIDFGTPDTSIVTDVNESVWINIEAEDPWWTSKVNGFRWGPEWDDKTEYAIPEKFALTDTGSSCIIGPSKPINSIMGTIFNTSDSVVENSSWGYLFDCADKKHMPSFELLYGGYWMKVNPEDYVIDVYDD